MKSSFIVLSLGATSLAAPLGLDSLYNALFARDPVQVRQETPNYSILPTGIIPSGTVLPTGTATGYFPTGTSTGTAVPAFQPPSKLHFKPLSINYQLAPTIAADVLKKRQDDELPEFSLLPSGTGVPTATGVLPTGTGAPYPTGTGAGWHGIQPKPFPPPEKEGAGGWWSWFTGLFGGN
ncbi:hypothetical protein BDV96DRAFT_648330 [Lophiotrema nucula]|uniref:Uncharacterized protein n=1 Tax=Lophiotrema nucula TaxID=690887 RepID=A0A6A5Z1Q9_9PLEO|nr:hypothetical protein BDV96DRAFT_648330 [Lophiotrema nucula]